MMEASKDKTYIALDVGERRIGVARIHELAGIAEPLEVIDTSVQNVFESIRITMSEYQADGIVIGLPRGLDGQETSQTIYCQEFAKRLKEEITIPVYMIDEAGTSKAADDRLQNYKSNISRDSVAAAILLEDFVSHKNKQELEI